MEKHHKATRRDMIKKGALGAAAVAASTVLGTGVAQAAKNPVTYQLSGKTAFITGGARGIGLAIAEEMAKAGANIVLFDIASGQIPHVGYAVANEGDLQSAQATIEALNVKCLAIKGDVRSRGDLENAMKQAVASFGSLDIVVANAGVTQVGAMEEFSPEEISVVYDINVEGVVKTTQAAAPIMKQQKSGKMIFIASALGRMGNELFPIYASSKWAVIGIAKSAALSYGRDNILCNVVSPGLVKTKFADNPYVLSKMMPNDPAPTFDKVSEMLRPGNPIDVGHLEPEDVAKAAMIFATDATARVTGEVFDVSYGSLARSIA
ncbi:SDR family NAD(P)-dependent oxidoreductase [Tunicatimonas pelagia]|uniref:SDR family NAD(P)-dependent oxidoreductase n=1 Tax=Tunicatimonas pelagia TaxID=931531 RepID=UPI002665308C|nr:SDR family NAD(P)-dependent oxidoreductase [Tunicatimonas pelagia]WKN44837.1 SDR family NAD(P)-dependent oxidoreductase [Tunicatimonas pelagia]